MDTDLIARLQASNASIYSTNMSVAIIKQQNKSQEAIVEMLNQSVEQVRNTNLPIGVGKNVDTLA